MDPSTEALNPVDDVQKASVPAVLLTVCVFATLFFCITRAQLYFTHTRTYTHTHTYIYIYIYIYTSCFSTSWSLTSLYILLRVLHYIVAGCDGAEFMVWGWGVGHH